MVEWLSTKSEWQYAYGSFHLLFVLGIIIFALLLISFLKKCNDKTFKLIIGISWLILIVLEIGKQIVWGYHNTNGKFVLDWNAFPFQFCSLVFYIWPLLIILPDCKIKDCLYVFSGTFLFFAAFAYLLVPVSLCNLIFINIQTMTHHGLQLSIGLFIFAHEYNKFTLKRFLQSIIVFAIAVALAIIINVLVYLNGHYCNMFELNPMPGCETPSRVYSDVLKATNFPIYGLTYMLISTLCSFICFYAVKTTVSLNRRNKKVKLN